MDAIYQEGLPSDQLATNRVMRVCILICMLGMLNVFDLNMTVLAIEHGVMFEANPVADFVINAYGVVGVSLFKSLCVGVSLIFFAIARRHPIAEIGCAAGVVIYACVGFAWMLYPMEVLIACQ